MSLQALKEKELGNTAYKNKDFETALKHYEEAIRQDPTNMSYISNKAGTHMRVNVKMILIMLWFNQIQKCGPRVLTLLFFAFSRVL